MLVLSSDSSTHCTHLTGGLQLRCAFRLSYCQLWDSGQLSLSIPIVPIVLGSLWGLNEMMYLALHIARSTHSINENGGFYFHLCFAGRTLVICNISSVHWFGTLSLMTCDQGRLGQKELNIANPHSCCPLGSASDAQVSRCKSMAVCRAPWTGGVCDALDTDPVTIMVMTDSSVKSWIYQDNRQKRNESVQDPRMSFAPCGWSLFWLLKVEIKGLWFKVIVL